MLRLYNYVRVFICRYRYISTTEIFEELKDIFTPEIPKIKASFFQVSNKISINNINNIYGYKIVLGDIGDICTFIIVNFNWLMYS